MERERPQVAAAGPLYRMIVQQLHASTGSGYAPTEPEAVDAFLAQRNRSPWVSRGRRQSSGEAVSAMTAELSGVMREMASDITVLKEKLEALALTVNELRAEIANRPVVKSLVLHDLSSEAYGLRQPLSIVVEEYANETIATLSETEVFGTGATEPEAIGAFEHELLALYEELRSSDRRRLGLLPRKWLRILNRILKRRRGVELQIP